MRTQVVPGEGARDKSSMDTPQFEAVYDCVP